MRVIITCVTDSKYLLMAHLFLASYLHKTTIAPTKIIVGAIGLSQGEAQVIRDISPIIEVRDIGQADKAAKVHDAAWVRNVCTKTSFLREVFLGEHFDILILADVDQIVIKDPTELTNGVSDVCLTRRIYPVARPEYRLDYIASIAAFRQTPASEIFINNWIKNLECISCSQVDPPYETLALNVTASDFLKTDFITDLAEDTVSCPNSYKKDITEIIHLKSEGRHAIGNVFSDRFNFLDDAVKSKILEEVYFAELYL